MNRGGVPRRPLADRVGEKIARRGADDCWLWTGATNRHYGKVTAGGHAGKILLAHRVVWELSFGPIPAGLFVLHRCDTPLCCNPAHLWLGTPKDNSQDMAAKGRSTTGRRWKVQMALRRYHHEHPDVRQGGGNGRAVLTESDIPVIRAAYTAGATLATLGDR